MSLRMAILCMLLCRVSIAFTQDNTDKRVIASVPVAYFDKVSRQSEEFSSKIDKKSEIVLSQLQRRQERILRKLYKTDSLTAINIINASERTFKKFQDKLDNPGKLKQYIPFLDTLKTSLKFLSKNKELLSGSSDLQTKMDGAMASVNGLEEQFRKAELIKQYINEQKEYLTNQLGKFGFTRQIAKLNEDVYYYGQQMAEYKQMIKDPKKLERKALDLISRTKLFQNFMKKNSMLASLFHLPSDDPGDGEYLQNIAGLQTRSQIDQLVRNQVSIGGLQQIQSNVQQGHGELEELKNLVNQFGEGAHTGNLPSFKPNNQKTKSFWKRFELGTNMQSQRTNGLLPVTTDLGLSAGFKFNDKSIVGVGASYKLGWGKDIQHIKISHQGAGIRSFIDYKWKKSLWISGGYEVNYLSEFRSIDQLKQYSAWQQSGLIGLTKKLPIKAKLVKGTNVQLLFDFLSYQQIPRTHPLIFRVGYNF